MFVCVCANMICFTLFALIFFIGNNDVENPKGQIRSNFLSFFQAPEMIALLVDIRREAF